MSRFARTSQATAPPFLQREGAQVFAGQNVSSFAMRLVFALAGSATPRDGTLTGTHPTDAMPVFQSALVDVAPAQSVATHAMRLPGVAGARAFAAHHVFADGDGLQMIGANARTVAAEVIQYEPGRYGSDQLLVGEAVRQDVRAVQPEHASAGALCCCPFPAQIALADLRPKAVGNRLRIHTRNIQQGEN